MWSEYNIRNGSVLCIRKFVLISDLSNDSLTPRTVSQFIPYLNIFIVKDLDLTESFDVNIGTRVHVYYNSNLVSGINLRFVSVYILSVLDLLFDFSNHNRVLSYNGTDFNEPLGI